MPRGVSAGMKDRTPFYEAWLLASLRGRNDKALRPAAEKDSSDDPDAPFIQSHEYPSSSRVAERLLRIEKSVLPIFGNVAPLRMRVL
jgi:hypothetical protein